MGLGGISVWQLLIVLAIVVLLFGASRLRTLGRDLGSAIRGFRKSLQGTDVAGDGARPEDARTAAVHVVYSAGSDHTANSLPLGSAKWNLRPPGNEKTSFTIRPPEDFTVARVAARSAL